MSGRPIISELLKITVDRSFKLSNPEFATLRTAAVQAGVQEQYYGIAAGEPDHLSWVIQWPADLSTHPSEYIGPEGDFRKRLAALDVRNSPTNWFIKFEDAKLPRPALESPICQICTILVKPTSDLEALMPSLKKTFTDCYDDPYKGFTGGHWGLAENEPRLAWYFLGWKSREAHDLYAATPLFDIEIDKLMPHMAGGWAHYIKYTKETS
ncbi:hypothetical protein Hypma_013816 [Hypsizygus marmoreus]|uniref:ABM domain-containing protein n=1 Tax=Hypsizygus marmoreus TaxID=39966 RepID=A0A369K537_HYPMA|nr:hypothetical protein Hypma_013816 [Hypsizygus marmoreus]